LTLLQNVSGSVGAASASALCCSLRRARDFSARFLIRAQASIMDAPHATKKETAAGHDAKENKENASTALGGPQTPPRKPPVARDKLKTLAMPKALKI